MTISAEKYLQNCESSIETLTDFCVSRDCEILGWDNLKLSWAEKLALLTYRFGMLPQRECPVTHEFLPGLYTRTMRIPAGTLFLGRAHIDGHKCELVEGSVLHITEHDRRVVHAPFSMVTTPGYQMVLFTLTDVVGRTVHPNPEESRDTEWLERDIFQTQKELLKQGEAIHRRLQ